MSELNHLTNYYSNYDEESRLISKYGQVEFLTTMRYIKKYLKKDMRILEVGAGTGRYSLTLAEMGFKVDSIELIEHNINIFKSKTKDNFMVNIKQGTATDLSIFDDETFDITLVLGPLYHLFDVKDKKKAIEEAIRVTKRDGIIFVAYCMNDATIIDWGFKKGNIIDGLKENLIDDKTFKCYSSPYLIFELHRKDDIDKLMENFNVKRLHFVGTDLFTNHMRDTINEMSDKIFEAYLKYHFSVCENSDLIGITHHSLDIFKKK